MFRINWYALQVRWFCGRFCIYAWLFRSFPYIQICPLREIWNKVCMCFKLSQLSFYLWNVNPVFLWWSITFLDSICFKIYRITFITDFILMDLHPPNSEIHFAISMTKHLGMLYSFFSNSLSIEQMACIFSFYD